MNIHGLKPDTLNMRQVSVIGKQDLKEGYLNVAPLAGEGNIYHPYTRVTLNSAGWQTVTLPPIPADNVFLLQKVLVYIETGGAGNINLYFIHGGNNYFLERWTPITVQVGYTSSPNVWVRPSSVITCNVNVTTAPSLFNFYVYGLLIPFN